MVLALSRVTLRALDMSFITFSIISVTKNTVQQNGNHMTRTRYTKNSTVGDGIQMHNKQVSPSSSLLYTEEKCEINVPKTSITQTTVRWCWWHPQSNSSLCQYQVKRLSFPNFHTINTIGSFSLV